MVVPDENGTAEAYKRGTKKMAIFNVSLVPTFPNPYKNKIAVVSEILAGTIKETLEKPTLKCNHTF